MKTKLFSFLFFLTCAFSFSQITLNESFESGLPAGWSNSNYSVTTAASCSGSQSLTASLFTSGSNANLQTTSYISNGNAITFSYGYKAQSSSTGYLIARLYYEVNNTNTWTQVNTSDVFSTNCQTLSATLAAGVVPAGTPIRFRAQINFIVSGGVVYIDNVQATQAISANSSTEYNFDGTYVNTAGSNPFIPTVYTSFTTDRNGNANRALNITSNSGVSATIPGLPYGNSARTISFWAKLNMIQTPYNMTFSYGQGNMNNAIGGSFNSTTVDFFGYANNFSASSNSNVSTWYHFAYVYDGTTAKIYKNGALLSSQAKSWNTLNNNDLFKLGVGVGGELNFVGAIDDLKIYNYALNDSQISSLYTNNALIGNSLVYQFNFDNSYSDITGNKNFTTEGVFTLDRNGNPNNALRFTNTAATVNLENLPVGNSSRSISIWLKMHTYWGDNYLFGYGTQSANQYYGFSLTSNQINNYAWANDLTSPTSIPLNTWKHLVVTFNSVTDVASIYLDGVLITSAVKSAWNTANNTMFILSSDSAFEGSVDDLKIYNYELSPTEISNLYNYNVLSFSDFNQNSLEVEMYPNPVNDVLNIEIENEIKSVEIYNIQGQKVLQSSNKQIETNSLNSGIYMVRIEDVNGAVATQKLIKK